MFDMGIGMSEMLLIAVIALIVFGPEKFPDYAKIFLRAMRDIQGYVTEVKTDLAKEINPLKRELDKLNRENPEKLIDALMKGGEEKEGGKGEEKPASADTGDTADNAADSAADANPYGEYATGEKQAEGKIPETDAGDDEFVINPPDRMD